MKRLFVLLTLAGTAHAGTVATFQLTDHLRRAWTNELVFFAVDAKVYGNKKVALYDPATNVVAHQWVPADQSPRGKPSIAFTANVPVFGSVQYQLRSGTAKVDTAPTNSVITVQFGPNGPLDGVFVGGKRVGGCTLSTTPKGAEVKVVATGPVFTDTVAKYRFGEKGFWQVKTRQIRGEPVVLVEETFDSPAEAECTLTLGTGNQIFFRRGNQVAGAVTGEQTVRPLGEFDDKQPAFVLEPWLHWQRRERQGNWFGLCGTNLLLIAAIHPSEWTAPREIIFNYENGALTGKFPFRSGRRDWMLGVFDATQSLSDKDRQLAPLPHRYVIKYTDFPLDAVKEYVLEWPATDSHPHVLVTPADIDAWRKTVEVETLRAKIPRLLQTPVSPYSVQDWLEAYFATGDEQLGRYLCNAAAQQLQSAVDMFTQQPYRPTIGFAPHHQQAISKALTFADAMMPIMPVELQRRVRAQAAFLGYTLDRTDYCSPERGFAGLPNMTTSAYGYKATVACFIPSHPLAKHWAADAIRQAKTDLETQSDANGGWLEAPHYAMVSYDQILGIFLMAHNAGFAEELFHPKMKTVINWFSQIAVPPDARFAGFRYLPPIGNTEMFEPSGEFGIVAKLWRDRDPQFARQMQWMFRQERSFPNPGIGGGYPALEGYRRMLLDATIGEEAPAWTSALFPETGVLLRNGFPGNRETRLHMIAGNHRSHYDADSGSVTIWGKGRVLCDDFGYSSASTGESHSMVTSLGAADSQVMHIEEFVTGPTADYVRASKGAWTRQVILVKNPDYFVINDTLPAPDRTAMWRLWTISTNLDVGEHSVKVVGHEDVDMDVTFAWPVQPVLKTETKTIASLVALKPDGSQGQVPITQNAIVVPGSQKVTAVLYPRLKTEVPVNVTTEGQVIRVGDDRISFAGPVSIARGTNAPVILDKGKIVSSNQIDPGNPFANHSSTTVTASLTNFAGKDCIALKLTGDHGNISLKRCLLVDPAKNYRVNATLRCEQPTFVTVGGYANDGTGNISTGRSGVWQYSLGFDGPTGIWKTVATTIGPGQWPTNALASSMSFWIGGSNVTLYVSDLAFEELP